MDTNVPIVINGNPIRVERGVTVAAAIAMAGQTTSRLSVKGENRGPLCGMGICYECRVTINRRPHQVSCQIRVEPGMDIIAG
jgi:hypothetical protein